MIDFMIVDNKLKDKVVDAQAYNGHINHLAVNWLKVTPLTQPTRAIERIRVENLQE